MNVFAKLMAVFVINFPVFAMQQSFEAGKQEAAIKSNGIEGQIKSSKPKALVPQFQESFQIDKKEADKSFEHLEHSRYGKDLREIHKTREPYILDDTELFMVRSEKIVKEPKKEFEGTEVIEKDSDKYTIETCEECPKEEYFVTARRTKINLVYMTAGKTCTRPGNHGHLTIDVRISEMPTVLLEKGGPFNNIVFVNKYNDGPRIYERYNVNGYDVVLKKTIQQDNHPGLRSGCYLARSLEQYVLNPKDLINNLLGLNTNDNAYWGEIGNAQLNTINDEFYFIFDDKGAHYEQLVKQGLCSYESAREISKDSRSITEEITYACHSSCKDTCAELRLRGCSREPGPVCLEKNASGDKCLRWRWKFKCHDKIKGAKHSFSKHNPFCLGGDCIESDYESDKDMVQALGYLSILEAARKEYSESKTDNISIFKGTAHSCNEHIVHVKNCCKCSGWGVSLGITGCDENDRILGMLRGEGKCVRVGDYCYQKLPITGTCLTKKHVFCCFGSKFAKLLQEQGKPQIGLNFGSPKEPNCRGFTPEELSRIDFSKLDLSEIIADVMEDAKKKFDHKQLEHYASDVELDHIRKVTEDRIKGKFDKNKNVNTEGKYLQENMKHLTASLKGGRK